MPTCRRLPASRLLPVLSLAAVLSACASDHRLTPLDPEGLAEAQAVLSTDRVQGELVVALDDLSQVEPLADDLAVDVIDTDETLGLARLAVHEDDIAEVLARLAADPRVAAAEPDYLAFAASLPVNDPFRQYQWNLEDIGVAEAWPRTVGAGVTVAVLDTGVADDGRDGFSNLLTGADFIDGDRDPYDLDGHGTHVAGTVAQATNNGVGVAGVAPGAAILPVRVLGASGAGSYTSIARGITWAVDNDADVLNLSLGGPSRSTTLSRAVAYAADRGVLVVAASGNEAAPVGWPAADPNAIAVGATRYDGQLAPYSNTGPELDLTAPGGDTRLDQNRDGLADGIVQETLDRRGFTWTPLEGTSMAAPHVSGALALLLSLGASPDEARDLLYDTAVDVGAPGRDRVYGHGRLAVDRAVAAWVRGGDPVREDPVEEDPRDRDGRALRVSELQAGDLMLTEVVPNPSGCDDTRGEWVEVRNATARAIDLRDLVILDERGSTGRITESVTLSAGASAVLGRSSAAAFCTPGVRPVAFYGAEPTLNNGGDAVGIADPARGLLLDRSPRWSSAPDGASAQRDEDDAWCWVTGGTPGRANMSCR